MVRESVPEVCNPTAKVRASTASSPVMPEISAFILTSLFQFTVPVFLTVKSNVIVSPGAAVVGDALLDVTSPERVGTVVVVVVQLLQR